MEKTVKVTLPTFSDELLARLNATAADPGADAEKKMLAASVLILREQVEAVVSVFEQISKAGTLQVRQ